MSFRGYNVRTRQPEHVTVEMLGYMYGPRGQRRFFAGGFGSDGTRIKSFISEDAAYALAEETGIPISAPPVMEGDPKG